MLGDFQTASQANVQDFVLARAAGRKEKNTPARAQLTVTFRRGSQAYVDAVRKLVHRPLEVIESKREEKTVFVALDVFRNTRNCWICTPCCLSLSSVEPRASCSSPDSCLKSQALSQSPRGREPALPAGAQSALGLNPGSCRRSQTPSQCRDRHAAGNQPFLPVRTQPWGSNPGPCRRSQTPSQCRDRHAAGNQPFLQVRTLP